MSRPTESNPSRLPASLLARSTARVRPSLLLPADYEVIAVLPFAALADGSSVDQAFVLLSRDVEWNRWQDFAQAHAALDDATFERDENLADVWTVDELAHPPHVRWLAVGLPGAVLAGRGEDGALYRLVGTPFQDVTREALHALADDGGTPADELERLEIAHWSSKLGGAPSFIQGGLRARSRSRGELLPFLGQLRADVVYDPYGYTFYLWGDPTRGELAVGYQR